MRRITGHVLFELLSVFALTLTGITLVLIFAARRREPWARAGMALFHFVVLPGGCISGTSTGALVTNVGLPDGIGFIAGALVALAIFAGSSERVSWLSGPPRPLEPAPDVATTDDCSTSPTWESFGQGFLRTWCTPCHSSGLPEGARQGAPLGVDFDTY